MISSSDPLVLFVGRRNDDRAILLKILSRSHWPAATNGRAKLEFCFSREAALSLARTSQVRIVLCDDDVDWRQILESLRSLPAPPDLIVTSRRADDRLWCEALNLGAYDVLAQPFDSTEVVRVLTMAWHRSEARMPALFEDVDIASGAHVLEDFGPHTDADLAEVRLAQQQHQSARLTDSSADTERDFALQDRLMIRVA